MRIKANKITQHFKIKLKNSLLHWKMKIRGTKFSFSFDSPKKSDKLFSFKIQLDQFWNPYNYLFLIKSLNLSHKLKFSNSYIFKTSWCNPPIFQTLIYGSNIIHSLTYLRPNDIGFRKSEFVAKTQFLWFKIRWWWWTKPL